VSLPVLLAERAWLADLLRDLTGWEVALRDDLTQGPYTALIYRHAGKEWTLTMRQTGELRWDRD
jgi:hypothetical protein